MSNQAAWETPFNAVHAAISSAVKPRPPSLTGVYWATGKTAVKVNAMSIT